MTESFLSPPRHRLHPVPQLRPVSSRQALDSLIAQLHTNWEAIVVDEASEDDSLEVAAAVYRHGRAGAGPSERRTDRFAEGREPGALAWRAANT